jgi:fermentation-respiration switch protein FrsA (DUF1100 family)
MRSSSLSSRQLKDQVDTLLYRTTLGHHVDNAKFVTVKKQYESFVTPWVRTYLKLNPADYLVKVKCPVLALNGTKDVQVISEANLAGIAKALDQGGNKQYKVVPLEGINHALQKAKTGNETEYTQISETINPIVLTTVSNWINTLSL